MLNATPFSFAFFSQTARRTAEVTTQDGQFHGFTELAQPPWANLVFVLLSDGVSFPAYVARAHSFGVTQDG